jgi:hypothetical protein
MDANQMKIVIIGWADISSRGRIFEFDSGPVGDRYPHLMHIYSEQVTPDLKRVEIHLNATKEQVFAKNLLNDGDSIP